MIIMVSVGTVFALQMVIYIVHNRRVAQGKRPKDGSAPIVYTP